MRARAKARLPQPERLHKELLKNTVEIVTGVCRTVPDAMADLRRTLEVVVPAGDDLGIDLFGQSQIWRRLPDSAMAEVSATTATGTTTPQAPTGTPLPPGRPAARR